MSIKQVYLDYQSTTPCDKRVFQVMQPYFCEYFGNPHSRSHGYGWNAEEAVENARKSIADLIHADPREIVFTSGATESNNLALKGIAHFYKDKGNHIITCETEHKCILDTCRYLEQDGFKVTYLPVKTNGLLDLDVLKEAITEQTILISIMAVSNEIGVIQPIEEIGDICRSHSVFFHTDAAQALGKIPLNMQTMKIDLMSLSSHKVYGPKGIGVLFVRRKPRVRIRPLINGGGQERGMRSGTLPTPLCVGFGHACKIIQEEFNIEYQRIQGLSARLYSGIMNNLEEVYLNGDLYKRVPHNLNLSFAYVEGESLIMSIKGLAVSSGSACTSSSLEPSYVLKSLGVSEDLAHTSIRFGLGRFTTQEDIDYTVDCVKEAVHKLRAMSPLWEMAQSGIDLKKINWNHH